MMLLALLWLALTGAEPMAEACHAKATLDERIASAVGAETVLVYESSFEACYEH